MTSSAALASSWLFAGEPADPCAARRAVRRRGDAEGGRQLRHLRLPVAGPETCASDLAFRAAQDLLSAHAVDPASIDLLLMATQTPDYLLPTTACILQQRAGLPTSAARRSTSTSAARTYVTVAGHERTACSWPVWPRSARAYRETPTRLLHPQDRAVVPLFGDAGTATLLERASRGARLRAVRARHRRPRGTNT